MPIVKIRNLGEFGIIDDVPAFEIPVNAFSNGENVVFHDNKVAKIKGHQQVFGTAPIIPWWAQPYSGDTQYLWAYGGQTKLYATDMTNHFNITRQSGAVDQDYSASLDIGWNGGVLGGIPIFNNGNDFPQEWNPAQTSQRCADLTYDASRTWADLNYTAKVIRIFKTYAIALDVTKVGTRFSNLVKWSDSAAPGTLPSWDETDATIDAGENPIGQINGQLVDGLSLRDTFVIYSTDSAWGMQNIGGRFVFRFFKLFSDGILSRHCVQPFKNFHLVLTQGDLLVHDGQAPQPILHERRRNWLFRNIDNDNYERTFIVPNYKEDEMWICFPSTGSSLPDTALVWDYIDNTFGVRELPNTPFISYGVIDPGTSQIWDDDSQVWDQDGTTWDEVDFNQTILKPLLLNNNFFEGNTTEQFDGSNFIAYAERTGLDFGDTKRKKRICCVYPRMTGNGTVQISIGAQEHPDDAVNWEGPYDFTPGTDYKIPVRVTGRLLAYRIESNANITWSADGIDFDVQVLGFR